LTYVTGPYADYKKAHKAYWKAKTRLEQKLSDLLLDQLSEGMIKLHNNEKLARLLEAQNNPKIFGDASHGRDSEEK
jgi:hypothetical protein